VLHGHDDRAEDPEDIRPTAVEVSMPWSSTTRSTLRAWSWLDSSNEVLERPAEPVKLGDDELIASAESAQCLVELAVGQDMGPEQRRLLRATGDTFLTDRPPGTNI
jgi:hypothetical protein